MDNLWFKKLLKIKDNAYVPYSHFNVACIVLLKNDKEIQGVNVENAAYPAGICAERCALSQMYAQGYTKKDVKELFLYTSSQQLGSPCGVCRQVISEAVDGNVNVHMFSANGCETTVQVKELLPFSFGIEQLNAK